jgi:hypothetical protein
LIFASAGRLLEPVIQALVDQFDASFEPGPEQRFVERRHLEITGLFGAMHIFRDYYLQGQKGFCPADNSLGLEGAYTPALSRMMLRAAAKDSYGEASADLFEYAGVRVCDRQIQRLVQTVAPAIEPWLDTVQDSGPVPLMYISGDGTGVPMRKEELQGRRGKQADGSAKTREVKLGCVFLQTEVDAEGHPIRKEDSTTYVGSFEGAAEFGLLLRQEARRRGLGRALKVVFIGDGAAWVWEVARVNFPGAVLILDFYHALQHVHGLIEALWGQDTAESYRASKRWKSWLLKDKADQIIRQAREQLARALDTEQGGERNRLPGTQFGAHELRLISKSGLFHWLGSRGSRLQNRRRQTHEMLRDVLVGRGGTGHFGPALRPFERSAGRLLPDPCDRTPPS